MNHLTTRQNPDVTIKKKWPTMLIRLSTPFLSPLVSHHIAPPTFQSQLHPLFPQFRSQSDSIQSSWFGKVKTIGIQEPRTALLFHVLGFKDCHLLRIIADHQSLLRVVRITRFGSLIKMLLSANLRQGFEIPDALLPTPFTYICMCSSQPFLSCKLA